MEQIKRIKIIGIIFLISVVGIISIATALRISQLGNKPVSPSVPQSKPKAVGDVDDVFLALVSGITPNGACIRGVIVPTPTLTPTAIPTATRTPIPTATRTPVPTATKTPTPINTQTPIPTATRTPTLTVTPTPTVPVCVRPSQIPSFFSSGTSRLTLQWDCSQPQIDCFTINKYSSNLSTSGNCTSCSTIKSLIRTIKLSKTDPNVIVNNGICTYTDVYDKDVDFRCLSYEITAGDYTGTTGSCTTNCSTDNGTTCCISTPKNLQICGIPADPITLTKTVNQPVSGQIRLSWVDQSVIEQGFYVYRKLASSGFTDNFNILVSDVAVGTILSSSGSGSTVLFIDGIHQSNGFNVSQLNNYVYSIRAFTSLCGCVAPTSTPTLTPTATLTPTPLPTATPTQPIVLACNGITSIPTDLTSLKTGDSVIFTVNFVGITRNGRLNVVDDVGIVVKRDGVTVFAKRAGVEQSQSWTSPAFIVQGEGNYEVSAFIMFGGIWR